MPWCDDCSRFWNPPEMRQGGRCPSCGQVLGGTADDPLGTEVRAAGAEDVETGLPTAAGQATLTRAKGAPWHFKLLVVGVTVYMIYRIYWLIEWLPKHL
jgi:hypothetical protein